MKMKKTVQLYKEKKTNARTPQGKVTNDDSTAAMTITAMKRQASTITGSRWQRGRPAALKKARCLKAGRQHGSRLLA